MVHSRLTADSKRIMDSMKQDNSALQKEIKQLRHQLASASNIHPPPKPSTGRLSIPLLPHNPRPTTATAAGLPFFKKKQSSSPIDGSRHNRATQSHLNQPIQPKPAPLTRSNTDGGSRSSGGGLLDLQGVKSRCIAKLSSPADESWLC
jgi:hypothetical protein